MHMWLMVDNGLVIVDVSDPAAPTLKGSYNTGGNSFGVALGGNYAYVADDANGLVIVDVSIPAAPALKGSRVPMMGYNTAGGLGGMEVAGNYTYVAGSNGLEIFRMDKVIKSRVHNINRGTNYTTIQSAIDDARAGDEIHVDNGTYFENVNVNKQLTLRGIGMPFVDARGNGSAITLSADGIILVGFTAKGAPSASEAGIKLNSSNNTLSGNNASNNYYGIFLFSSSNNTIYNNYFNNTKNAFNDGINIWNITKTVGTNIIGGPYLGGNIWAHPNETGFSQTCTDGNKDGICDSSYTLDSSNIDYLPLAPNETADAPTASPTLTIPAVPTEIPKIGPIEKTAGFEVFLAIIIILAVYTTRRKKIE